MELTEGEYRSARSAAKRMAKVSRGLIGQDDLFQELVLFMLANDKRVVEWREADRAGSVWRYRALCTAAQKVIVKERLARTGAKPEDLAWYTVETIKELLPMVWDYDDWTHPPTDYQYEGTMGTSRPSEGNTRLAMLADVAYAVRGLSRDEQVILENAFRDGGVNIEVLAEILDVTADGARKKVTSIVRKLQDRLGGEPPWYSGRREKPEMHHEFDE